eukprot:scaffold121398_cov24-Prasinocladus_malaysianus.AAC.1
MEEKPTGLVCASKVSDCQQHFHFFDACKAVHHCIASTQHHTVTGAFGCDIVPFSCDVPGLLRINFCLNRSGMSDRLSR